MNQDQQSVRVRFEERSLMCGEWGSAESRGTVLASVGLSHCLIQYRHFDILRGEPSTLAVVSVEAMRLLGPPPNTGSGLKPMKEARITRIETVITEIVSRAPASRMRVQPDKQLIAEYARTMAMGGKFPPVVIFEDENGRLHLADGLHRVEAASLVALKDNRRPAEIVAEIWPGSFKDAVRYALGANSRQGRRMTDADYKGAIELAFDLGLVEALHAKDLAPAVVRLTGCSISTAQRYSSEHRKTMVANRDRRIIQMHRERRSRKAISAELQVGPATVAQILHRSSAGSGCAARPGGGCE
jgi:hypothetical protein